LNDEKTINNSNFSRNAPNLFVDFLLTNESNHIMATIRLTEIMNLLTLFQHCKIVNILSKIFGIFNQKILSNELFANFLCFIRIFQEITGGIIKLIMQKFLLLYKKKKKSLILMMKTM